jgi:ketosteroid isomerase-like protein
MSQKNVEIVRLAYERVNVGDIDGFLRFCTTDFEFRECPSFPAPLYSSATTLCAACRRS